MSDTLNGQLASAAGTTVNQVENLVSESGDALKRNGTQLADGIGKTFHDQVAAVRGALADAPQVLREKYEIAAESTDDYVHDKPWQAIGIGMGLGIGLGVGLGILLGNLTRR
jgi:ElaB/YqjD/DUF883 family membrane-anchored ribosome-binding protein